MLRQSRRWNWGYFFQFSFQDGLVQERYVFPESEQPVLRVVHHHQRGFEIASHQEEQTHHQANQNSDQRSVRRIEMIVITKGAN